MLSRAEILKSITPANIAQTIYLPLFVMAANPLPKSALANPFAVGTPPKRHDNMKADAGGERLTRGQRKRLARAAANDRINDDRAARAERRLRIMQRQGLAA